MQALALPSVGFTGTGLRRPECVLATASGRLYASDWRGGVSIIEPDGTQWGLLARDAGFAVRPNGIALLADGALLLAHLGETAGGVFRLDPDAGLRPWLTEVEGEALPPSNFVCQDTFGRTWITVSTRLQPRARGYRADCADGFVVLQDARGARVVADGLGYTNECALHPDGRHLFVNETFARRLLSFSVAADGSLSERRVVTEFGAGIFPDGLAFDCNGDAWITSIVSNRLIHVDARGHQRLVLEDSDAQHLARVEAAYRDGCMGREHLDTVHSRCLRNVSSLAFGGAGLRTGFLGCLLGDSIAHFAAPVAGHAPVHWDYAGPARPGGGAQ